ncbi:MAG: TIGR02270 family protein [Rubrivivax sp.]|nr:TIGR02270 family protein [Rubrivivax sp.]
MPLKRPIIPAIVAQHVEDAASLRAVRSVLVRAPHVKLLQLARADERLYAHLDGLAIAGDDGNRLAQSALETPGVGQLFVVAVNAIERQDRAQVDRLLALVGVVPDAARALASACGWVSPASLRGLIADLLGSADATRRWLGMAACGLHRVDPGAVLASAIADASDLLRAQALQTAGQVGRVDLLEACLSCADDADPSARFTRFRAAASALLLGGGARAARVLQSIAQEPEGFHRQALQLLLLQADPAQARAVVRELLARPAPMRLVIQATGWAGDVQAVPWLIQQMADPTQARVAGEAFTLLTGADLALLDLEGPSPETVEGGPTEDADDDNVALDEDESLPWPDVPKVKAWWEAHRSRLPTATRCFMGAAADEAHCQHVLRTGAQRQRAVAALLLALMRPGSVLFNVAAPAPRQQRLLGLPVKVS